MHGQEAGRKMLDSMQVAVFENRRIRKVNIVLVDAFGQPIGKFRLAEKHAGYGGAFTFGAALDALDITSEIVASFVAPGMDERAPYAFRLQLDQDSRVDRRGIQIMDESVNKDGQVSDAP